MQTVYSYTEIMQLILSTRDCQGNFLIPYFLALFCLCGGTKASVLLWLASGSFPIKIRQTAYKVFFSIQVTNALFDQAVKSSCSLSWILVYLRAFFAGWVKYTFDDDKPNIEQSWQLLLLNKARDRFLKSLIVSRLYCGHVNAEK